MAQNEWRKKSRKCIRAAKTPLGFLLALCFTTLIHGMVVNGINNVNVSTIERRYHFNSYESGLISSSYDIAFCVLCPFVTYYGNHHHRPRIMAIGLLTFVLGCVINSVPHFTQEKYILHRNHTVEADLCTESDVNEEEEETAPTVNYFYVFVAGGIFLGAGSIPVITLGITYLEDSTTKQKAASYIGLVGGLSAVGSVIGYLLGGYMLSFYVDFSGEKINLSPKDPLWIGAWWISLLIAAGLATIAILPIIRFPKQLKNSAELGKESCDSEVQMYSGARITENMAFGKTLKDFPTALKFLLKNSTFMFTTMGASIESFLLNGFAVFLPKLLQNQFHITTANAALLAGCVSVPGAIIGHFVSGFLVRRFCLKTPDILRASAYVTILSGFLTPCMLIYCARHNSESTESITNSRTTLCNYHCACDNNLFQPVCGSDSIEYFSACYAGCKEQFNNSTVYLNCSCITSSNNSPGTATKGSCSSKCDLLVLFLILLFILISLSFGVLTPSVVVILRCVPASQKSFGVGIQWFFIRVIGSIPSPLVIGAVFDASCSVWRTHGGDRASCWIYNSTSFARTAALIGATCKILSAICYTIAHRKYTPEINSSNADEAGFSDLDRKLMLPSQECCNNESVQLQPI